MRQKIVLFVLAVILFSPSISAAETWTTPTPVSELNSPFRDLSAFLTADGKSLYMASDRAAGTLDKNRIDLYVSHLVGEVWSTPQLLPYPPNNPTQWDDMPSLTLDGHYMYFFSAVDLMVSENVNGVWQAPVALGANVNSSSTDYTPSVSPDGQTMIFASNRPGGYGSDDLYITRKVDGAWQPAINLGNTINTSAPQNHPVISYDGRWLFYSQNNPTTADIFRAENINGVWQTPVKLPAPVNTTSDDCVTFFLDCTNTVWIQGPGGNWDIKTSTWLDAPGPNVCSSLVIPKGQWRVRVTLLTASETLKNDAVFIDSPIEQLLIRNKLKNVGTVVTTPFLSADQLVLSIRALGNANGEHDILTSDGEFAQVTRIDPLRYIVGFEDPITPPEERDFLDVQLLVELIGVEVNPWVDQNYLGESQAIEVATPEAETVVGLPMTMGLATDAVASIPVAGVSEPTYTIITEGIPELYSELLTNITFNATGDFIKLELLNGQNQVSEDALIEIFFYYPDIDDDGFVDGTNIPESLLGVYGYNQELGGWEKTPAYVSATENIVTAFASNTTLYALAENPRPKGKPITINCAMGPNPAPENLSHFLVISLICLGVALAARKLTSRPN